MRSAVARVAVGVLLGGLVSACGEGGVAKDAGGPVGTWALDVETTREKAFAPAQRNIAEQRKRLEAAPPEIRKDMEGKLPKDDDDLRARIKSDTERLTVEIELKAGGASRLYIKGNVGMGVKEETQEGTWVESGDDIRVTPKTRNGEPFAGTEEQRFAKKQGHLVFLGPGGHELYWLKRKEQK